MGTRYDHGGAAVETTLNTLIGSGDTSLVLVSATNWPSGGANGEFGITIGVIDPVSRQFISNVEKIKGGSRTGTTVSSLTRGADGTSAVTHAAGETIRHTFPAYEAHQASEHAGNTSLDDHTQYLNTARHASVVHTSAMLGTDSVGSDEIAANAVGASELADNAVDTNAIANLAVTAAKIADTTITAAKIANDTITATQIAADAIGTSELAADSVGSSELAAGAIDDENHFSSGLSPIIVSASNPGAVGANRLWYNTTAGKRALLKRNAGDTAWEVLEAYDWVAYTPTYPGMAAVGNAVHFARYIRKGGVVIINGFFRVGSTTVFAPLSNLAISLPTNAQAKDLDSFVNYPTVSTAEFFGHSGARASIAGSGYAGIGIVPQAGASKALDRMNFITTTGLPAWSATVPAAWAENDRFSYFVEYEPATLEDTSWV